jgi:sugar/nucleoside kinase (ribokinase family)
LGSKIHIEDVFFAMGGCGTNASVTLSLQGLKSAYCGQIGKDSGGYMVKSELKKYKVSTDLLKERQELNTAYSVILSSPGADRTILEHYGACHKLAEGDINWNKLKSKWFYVGPLSDQSAKVFEPIINFAAENKIKLAVNPGKNQIKEDLEILKKLLNKIDILFVNQEEASKISGVDYSNESEIFKILDDLVQGIVVMTKGPDGVVVSDGQFRYSAGIPKSEMVDRTGAGDAFASAFVAGYIDKKDIEHAIQLATANATAVIQKLGAVNGLLKKGEWGEWEKVQVRKENIV